MFCEKSRHEMLLMVAPAEQLLVDFGNKWIKGGSCPIFKAQPQWLAGEQRNYVIPPTPVSLQS